MAANTSKDKVGHGSDVQVARITTRGAIITALISMAGTVVVAVVGVRFAPSEVSQAIVPNASVTHTATVTVTATPTATVTLTPSSGQSEPSGAGATTGAGTALAYGDAVSHKDCSVPNRGQNPWFDQSVSLDRTGTQLPAITCRINWTGATTGNLDYLVPTGAHELSAQVGIDRQSPNTTALVRFDVLSVDGTKLTSATATYQNPQQIKVPVAGGSRVRLQVTMVRSTEEITYNGFVRVAWASPAFA
ncbi:hypothetical protein GCM10023194_34900 [Planotetraspora phitsanulokensis]|uniref:Glycosyl hydrolase family 98 putative carbohydrate-binding module domain-containing protein n=1 Tax=Planotetraspora phitsanulokensis TaxID=575192 RepID=A0A8J3XDC0_9ACTN|nr:NPCBM/NEW2 domain-containing protein [Planotetraspora phitsanulokensis]GII36381.1 hypothetical protein Pph01_13840 [Planotetraspora phitsanulokensis]